jgi:hypothetical protein
VSGLEALGTPSGALSGRYVNELDGIGGAAGSYPGMAGAGGGFAEPIGEVASAAADVAADGMADGAAGLADPDGDAYLEVAAVAAGVIAEPPDGRLGEAGRLASLPGEA